MSEFAPESFSLARLKRQIGFEPNIQKPGTATITSDEIKRAGLEKALTKTQRKEGINLDSLPPEQQKKIERVRQDFLNEQEAE